MEEERGQETGERGGGGEAYGGPGGADRKTAPDYPCDDVGGGSAQRHADAELVRAPLDGVAHDAVDADGGQQHGEDREGADEDALL